MQRWTIIRTRVSERTTCPARWPTDDLLAGICAAMSMIFLGICVLMCFALQKDLYLYGDLCFLSVDKN